MSTVDVFGCYEGEGTAVSVPSTIYHATYLSSRDHMWFWIVLPQCLVE